jgi:hypothetical protein
MTPLSQTLSIVLHGLSMAQVQKIPPQFKDLHQKADSSGFY